MEPCDLDLYLENNIFPKEFKYKILKKRKIDSQNFECELRIALNDFDDVKEWLKHFQGNTNTEWLLRQSTNCEENILNQLYVCQNSSYGKKRKYDDDEGSKSDFNCKAAISVKIKKGGKRTYYQDEYVKKGYKGIMRICFIHTHLIDKAEVLNMARQSEETKKAFIGYFTEGMSPCEAIKNHEEILLLEGHEDLGDSRKNPPEHWVYSLYEEWTKQIENRLHLESQLTRASVFWRLQNRSTPPSNNSKSKNIVKLCKVAEDISGMQIPADLHVSDDDDDDSDSENQYDSYDEDSTPQVSTPYASVSTTTHQSTASSAPLKLNVPNNINITRGCTLQVIKNNSGSNNKPSTNALPLFVRIGKGTNASQGNSVQIITTSHENNKKSVFKFLTVSANSRKYTDVELGKTICIANTKNNLKSGKAVRVVNNSQEHQNVLESLPKCGNITRLNSEHFIKNGNENILKTSTNIKPVFVRVKKGVVNKGASSLVKSHEVQKEAETVLQQILTRFQNSDDKDDIMPNGKNKQTFQMNKKAYHRSDIPGESMKPVLKKCGQNLKLSSLPENLFISANVLKDVQNQSTKDDQNFPKQVSKNISNNIIQHTFVHKALINTKDDFVSRFGYPSSDDKRDKNGLKNIDQHKSQKSNRFVDSEIFQDCQQQAEKLNSTDKINSRSVNNSFDNIQIRNLVQNNYCDIDQACSSSSLESFNRISNQSGSVQSIKNPISSAVQGLGLSRPIFDSIDPIHKFPKHDTEVTSSSAMCHENLFHDINQESTFHNSENLEELPIQGCPFPLPEDLCSTSAVENNSPYVGNQNGKSSQMFPLPLSKDLYNSNESNSSQILENKNQTDDQRYSLLLSTTFSNSSDPPNTVEDSENHSIISDLSYSFHNPVFSDSCSDMNSSRLSTEIDFNNEDSLQQIFPDLSKLEDELNNFNFEFPTVPSSQQVDLCSNHTPVNNQLSLIDTYTNSLPDIQANPVSLFDNYEENDLPLPENLKGNIEDIDILKNILNIKCSKLESSKLEFFQQPENYNQKEILEKWDSEMCRLRSLLEQNIHDRKLMKEATQFLERIKESVVTPSELAVLFSSACNLNSKQQKY